jgi:hypothetical protein
VVITSTYDEPMLIENIPNFLAVTSQGDLPMFTPILEEGEWLDEFTYSGKYLVNHIYYIGTAGMKVIVGTDMATNPIKDTTIQDVLNVDFLYLGITGQQEINFLVYPNSVSSGGLLNIRTPQTDIVVNEVQIFDLLGNLVFTFTPSGYNNNILSFNIPDLASGTYMLRMLSVNTDSVIRINITN